MTPAWHTGAWAQLHLGIVAFVNRLASETSPYLRQHRDNPVDWYAWGPPAFAAAKARNIPILLSVGYSACHWCHVMGHESFEDVEVAAEMNSRFINIKVDREERPDVDAIYMDAVQAMTGRGGWPMTVFLTPDGKPFYGGTYFPKPQFLQLMAAIDDVWTNRPDDVEQNVSALGEALDRTGRLRPGSELPGRGDLSATVDALSRSFDPDWGGFGSAPKFPSTMSIDLLLRAYVVEPTPALAQVITTSLDAMACGGIYDHLGGGFSRYSVDQKWLVPHFEKMLYDQALLIRVYLHAAMVFDRPDYRQVVTEVIEYVLRDLRHPDGGFYSAEDADSLDESGHSHEGIFYTWTADEVVHVLGDNASAALDWYEFEHPQHQAGNFEGRIILSRLFHRGQLLRTPQVEAARRALFEHRSHRIRPGLDDKVLTEWNGLMLSSLAEAASAFDRDDWRTAAIANGEFLLRELRDQHGRWLRSWQADGQPMARHAALAADHSALIDAFIRLNEMSGEARWIDAACSVADVLLDRFWDVDHGGLFTTADDAEQLVVRQKDLMDNATPSANSNAAWALYRLAAISGEQRYANYGDRILKLLEPLIRQSHGSFSLALAASDLRDRGSIEAVIVGDRPDLVAEAVQTWLPNGVVAWGQPTDSPLWAHRLDGYAYVCRNSACLLPVDTRSDLAAQLAAARLDA